MSVMSGMYAQPKRAPAAGFQCLCCTHSASTHSTPAAQCRGRLLVSPPRTHSRCSSSSSSCRCSNKRAVRVRMCFPLCVARVMGRGAAAPSASPAPWRPCFFAFFHPFPLRQGASQDAAQGSWSARQDHRGAVGAHARAAADVPRLVPFFVVSHCWSVDGRFSLRSCPTWCLWAQAR